MNKQEWSMIGMDMAYPWLRRGHDLPQRPDHCHYEWKNHAPGNEERALAGDHGNINLFHLYLILPFFYEVHPLNHPF